MKNIKTQNIPHEIFTQNNGRRATPELSKESFLEAFAAAHKNKEGVGEKETVEDLEDLEVEDSKTPLILWLPNIPILENEVSATEHKRISEFNEVIDKEASFNQLEQPQGAKSLPLKGLKIEEDMTTEPFNTLMGRAVLKPLRKETLTEGRKAEVADVADVNFEKIVSQTTEYPGQVSIISEALTKKVLDQQTVEKIQTSNSHQKASEIPQAIQSFIEDQMEINKISVTDSIAEFLNAPKLEKTEIEQQLPMQPKQMMQQNVEVEVEKLTTIDEEIIQVETILPNTDEIDMISSEEQVVETEFVNPIRQMPQVAPTTISVEVPEVIKVPTEHWVSEVETIVLDQIDNNPNSNKTVTARLQLTPEKLGEMDIELVIQNKKLTATIVVEHTETKEWLEQKVQQLNATLATRDIQVDDFQVIVSKQTQGMVDAGVQDNPFFGKKDQEAEKEKNYNQPVEEEQSKEKQYKITNSNTNNGRLSLWV